MEILDSLPRILQTKNKLLTVATPPKKIETLEDEYIAKLLNAGNERAKLYYLLALNCGMYYVDIAELKQSEVDWQRGRITRKRTKTRKHENAPIVDYKLWPETFRLLKKFQSEDKELALTNERGAKLRRETVDNEGKFSATNAITLVHRRLCERLDIPRHPFMRLRKTASSKLGGHSEFGRYAQYFLGHAPGNPADRSYIKPHEERFDEALDWLGEQFKLAGKAGGRKPKKPH